jgi:type VI secretion system ImpA/VasJ family protein
MSAEVAKAKIEPWLAPIAGPSPAGPDARYEPLHEQVRAEAAKLDNPAGGVPNWKAVVKSAQELTSQKSKDLLIESYAAYALFQTEGLMGLASGLYLLAESMDRFWDTMHPPAARVRARVNAIDWLTQKLDIALGQVQVGANDGPAVEALDASVKRLRSVIGERFTDQAPAFRPVTDVVERIKMSLPAGVTAASGGNGAAAAPPPLTPEAPASLEPSAPLDTNEGPPTEPPPPGEAPPPGAEAAPAAAPAAPPPPAAPAEPAKPNYEAELAERVKQWVEPCPGDNPAGIDAKYDPLHEELRAQVSAYDSPVSTPIEWPKFVPKAGSVLKDKSKDLLIASYMAFGLFQTDRLRGLATGLELITQICERYWEGCYPTLTRLRGRGNALGWMLQRIEAPLPDTKLTAADKHALELLDVASKRFGNVVRDKFEDAAPSYRPLLESVMRLKMALPAEAPPPPPPKPAAPAPAPRPAAAPAAAQAAKPAAAVALGGEAPAQLADPKEVGKFAGTVSKSLFDAAKALREAAPSDPAVFLFTRAAILLGAKLPQPNVVPAPTADTIKTLEKHLGAEAWPQLLQTAEASLRDKRFWLDAHRHAAVALKNLGPEFEGAYRVSIGATALFVKAFPEAMDLTFAGGMPFVSALTKEWIGSEVMPSGGGGGGGEAPSEADKAIADARALATGGSADEALNAFAAIANSARGARARFRAKLAMAQALSSGATAPVAEGIFDGLLTEIEQCGIERWEPELAADCYRSHLACLRALKKPGDAGISQQTALVYRRLCRVDPIAAFKAGG